MLKFLFSCPNPDRYTHIIPIKHIYTFRKNTDMTWLHIFFKIRNVTRETRSWFLVFVSLCGFPEKNHHLQCCSLPLEVTLRSPSDPTSENSALYKRPQLIFIAHTCGEIPAWPPCESHNSLKLMCQRTKTQYFFSHSIFYSQRPFPNRTKAIWLPVIAH